jgi:hypothetical protein
MHALGYMKEKPTDKINLNVYTSDQDQLDKWVAMRMRYPNLISTCVTNDWTYHSIRAQKKFANKYEFVKTNTLILRYVLFVFLLMTQINDLLTVLHYFPPFSSAFPCLPLLPSWLCLSLCLSAWFHACSQVLSTTIWFKIVPWLTLSRKHQILECSLYQMHIMKFYLKKN